MQHSEWDDNSRKASVLRDRRLTKIVGVGELLSVLIHAPTPCLAGSSCRFRSWPDRIAPELSRLGASPRVAAAFRPLQPRRGFASGRAVLVRDAHRQLCWLAIPAAARTPRSRPRRRGRSPFLMIRNSSRAKRGETYLCLSHGTRPPVPAGKSGACTRHERRSRTARSRRWP